MESSLIKLPYVIFLECTVAGLTLTNEEECLQSVRAIPAQHNATAVIVKPCVTSSLLPNRYKPTRKKTDRKV